LLLRRGRRGGGKPLLMDKAYEGSEMRRVARRLKYRPTVPPRKNRRKPWAYDKTLYRRRNEIERLFRRLKDFRRIFTRYDKLDVIFSGFIFFALSVMLLCVNTP
jgi:transposase